MADALSCLACPHCGASLVRAGGAVRCASGHSFDVARQGYLNLLRTGASRGTADTGAMVAARETFLASGHYAALMQALAETAAGAVDGIEGCLVDAGAGTGGYLAAVLDRLSDRAGLALDLSTYAARRAARAHPHITAVVCDVWGPLPVRSGVACGVLNVFAPRNAAEFARILAPGGAVVVVAPTPRHLVEIVGPLGMIAVDPQKDERLEAAFSGLFARESVQALERRLALSRGDAVALAMMGPSGFHLGEGEARRRAAELQEPVAATLSVRVAVWRKRSA